MYLFPFEMLEKGSDIVIYGAGMVGRDYAAQVIKSGYCRVLCALDLNYDKKGGFPLPVRHPDKIREIRNYSAVVIALASRRRLEEARAYLLALDVPADKITAPADRFVNEWDEIINYAYDYEDIILYKYLSRLETGRYVDVGANHPVHGSVTKLFYDLGWSGINVEPLEIYKPLYDRLRPRDVNLCVAVSDAEGERTFYVNAGEEGGSTFDRETIARLGGRHFIEGKVNAVPLDKILAEYGGEETHFLKIDVETHEKNVLKSVNLRQYRPWIIVVESALPMTLIPSHGEWEYLLLENGYALLASHSVNRYYAAQERREALLSNFLANPVVPFVKFR
jgi:FkbM family methyltransferase